MSNTLKGFNNVFDSTLSNDIQDALVEFFDWALLEKGNFFNTSLGELSPNGQDYSLLRLSNNQNYASGQAWDGFRANWVWQSGVNYSPPPTVGSNHTKPGISGVYVNDLFRSSTSTGTYAHSVDYYNGRVIFDSPLPTGSKVQAEHSYKWINVVYANNVPWLREIQYKTQQPGLNFSDKNNGVWSIPPESKLQLPAIAIEIVPNRSFKGYQLGGGQWVYSDVLFHCLAEDEITRNKLVDIVSLQNEKSIDMFNSNSINASGKMPLNYVGMPVSGALRYPDLVSQFLSYRLRFTKANIQEMQTMNSNFFGGIVRVTTEIIKLNI